jgi:hypothetical protein
MGVENNIQVGQSIPGPGISYEGPTFDYSNILGHSAELQPAGEHMRLDPLLPRRGILSSQIALEDWGPDWLVFHFDEPLEYDRAVHPYVLVRARWVNVPIGSVFCPVFILFDRGGSLVARDSWSSTDFQFESWGKLELIDE